MSLFPLDESDADTDATIENEDEDCEFVFSARISANGSLAFTEHLLHKSKQEFFSSAEQSNNKQNEFDSAHEQSSNQNGTQ